MDREELRAAAGRAGDTRFARVRSLILPLIAGSASAATVIDRQASRRVWRNPRTVLITGATGGLGAALARIYAAAGRTLILHGRDEQRLSALCRWCEERGARVRGVVIDLRQTHVAVEKLRAVSRLEPIDLLIVNAGVTRTIGEGEETESVDAAREVLAVNLDGALATVAGVLPDMRRRGGGQIAFVSSLAAYYGLPQTPTYCASKAALRAYGEALRSWLAPQGIAVSVVLPGFLDTSMTAGLSGPKPAMQSTERAASLIRHGLERNRARIAFPRSLAWGLQWLSVLPPALAARILSASGFGPLVRQAASQSAAMASVAGGGASNSAD